MPLPDMLHMLPNGSSSLTSTYCGSSLLFILLFLACYSLSFEHTSNLKIVVLCYSCFLFNIFSS